MSRILVTGASGFLGRPLVAALSGAGHEVRAAASQAPSPPLPAGVAVCGVPALGEVIDWAPVLTGVDAVVHLAGIAHTGAGIDVKRYDLVNRLATELLARAAARAGVGRFVFVSSIRAQAGPCADHLLTEQDVPAPSDAYGRSKLDAEAAVRAAGGAFTILRPVAMYGPGMKGNMATLARFAGMPLPLPLAGFRNRRSFLNVDAMVAAVLFVLQNAASAGETYIVADARPVTFAECVVALRAAAGRPPGLLSIPPGLIRALARLVGRSDLWERIGGELTASPAKLAAAGWRPESDTLAAIARLGTK